LEINKEVLKMDCLQIFDLEVMMKMATVVGTIMALAKITMENRNCKSSSNGYDSCSSSSSTFGSNSYYNSYNNFSGKGSMTKIESVTSTITDSNCSSNNYNGANGNNMLMESAATTWLAITAGTIMATTIIEDGDSRAITVT
jgi:Tfp pilus tip-associated adhesin PilY1